jgi:hypothetical protein
MHHEMQAHCIHHIPPHDFQPAAELFRFVHLNWITSVIDWSPVLVIPNGRFPIPCSGWITLVQPTTTASWHGLLCWTMYAKYCFPGFHNSCFLGVNDCMTYGDATGFRTLLDVRDTAGTAAGSGALTSPKFAANPPSSLYHDSRTCCLLLGAVRTRL